MPFSIVIVGTGIAGLGAAIALTNKGHKVTAIEATSQHRPIGGIIVLQANANRVLDNLGVYESLLPVCTATPYGPSTRRYKNGEFLIKKPAGTHEKEFGYPLWPLHRADLQQALYEAAVKRGVILRLGCRVVALDEDDQTLTVVVKGGERIDADVIVGADGIDSTVRRSIVRDSTCVRDSGMNTIQVTIPEATVRSNPETSVFMEQIGLWCGPSVSLAVMPVRRGSESLLGLDCCHRSDEIPAEGKNRKQNVAQLREYFKDFAPAIQKLLSYVKEANIWRMRETVLPSWVGKSGRVVLIGDAAHGALPWIGQGGGMVLEDAATLAECLERAKKHRDIPEALKAFQEIRQPRCKRVQEWSARKGQRATLPDGPEQEQRDENLRLFNAWVKAEPWDKVHIDEVPDHEAPIWKAWLCGHNAVNFANRELDKRFGPSQPATRNLSRSQ